MAWPCTPARRALLDGYDGARMSLLVWLHRQLADACRDLPADTGARGLHERMVGWATPRQPPPGVAANRGGFRQLSPVGWAGPADIPPP